MVDKDNRTLWQRCDALGPMKQEGIHLYANTICNGKVWYIWHEKTRNTITLHKCTTSRIHEKHAIQGSIQDAEIYIELLESLGETPPKHITPMKMKPKVIWTPESVLAHEKGKATIYIMEMRDGEVAEILEWSHHPSNPWFNYAGKVVQRYGSALVQLGKPCQGGWKTFFDDRGNKYKATNTVRVLQAGDSIVFGE